MENGQDTGVMRDDPGMKKRIPGYRVRFPKAAIERIRIGKNIGIEQLIEARLPVGRGDCRNCCAHREISPNEHRPNALVFALNAPISLKFLVAHSRYHVQHHVLHFRGEVLDRLRLEQVAQCQLCAERVAQAQHKLCPSSEWPPSRKKLSSIPTPLTSSNASTISATRLSTAEIGAR